MSEFYRFPYRVKWQNRKKKQRLLEVCITVHPLQVPRQMVTSLPHLCNGGDCWAKIGHTEPGIDGHRFMVYGYWFESGTSYVGERRTLNEAFAMMVGIVKSVVDQLQSPP